MTDEASSASGQVSQDLVQRYQDLQKELEVVKADLQFSQILENNEPDDLKELFISIRRDNTKLRKEKATLERQLENAVETRDLYNELLRVRAAALTAGIEEFHIEDTDDDSSIDDNEGGAALREYYRQLVGANGFLPSYRSQTINNRIPNHDGTVPVPVQVSTRVQFPGGMQQQQVLQQRGGEKNEYFQPRRSSVSSPTQESAHFLSTGTATAINISPVMQQDLQGHYQPQNPQNLVNRHRISIAELIHRERHVQKEPGEDDVIDAVDAQPSTAIFYDEPEVTHAEPSIQYSGRGRKPKPDHLLKHPRKPKRVVDTQTQDTSLVGNGSGRNSGDNNNNNGADAVEGAGASDPGRPVAEAAAGASAAGTARKRGRKRKADNLLLHPRGKAGRKAATGNGNGGGSMLVAPSSAYTYDDGDVFTEDEIGDAISGTMAETDTEGGGGSPSRRRREPLTTYRGGEMNVRFSELQDERLREAVRIYGTGMWSKIAEHVGDDITAGQCRIRWKRVLCPEVLAFEADMQSNWTREEDERLVAYAQERDSIWRGDETDFEGIEEAVGRTTSDCQDRLRVLTQRELRRNPFTSKEDAIISGMITMWSVKAPTNQGLWLAISEVLGRPARHCHHNWMHRLSNRNQPPSESIQQRQDELGSLSMGLPVSNETLPANIATDTTIATEAGATAAATTATIVENIVSRTDVTDENNSVPENSAPLPPEFENDANDVSQKQGNESASIPATHSHSSLQENSSLVPDKQNSSQEDSSEGGKEVSSYGAAQVGGASVSADSGGQDMDNTGTTIPENQEGSNNSQSIHDRRPDNNSKEDDHALTPSHSGSGSHE